MGLTIESKNCSIDMGAFGFDRLRTKVAELAGKDIGELYVKGKEGLKLWDEERTKFFEEYDKKVNELDKNYNYEMHNVLYFLYAPDIKAEMPVDVCKKLYEVIKDYDDNVVYGYFGRPDCAMFKDFKELVKDCIDNNCSMEWW